jgi:hypothetical protein
VKVVRGIFLKGDYRTPSGTMEANGGLAPPPDGASPKQRLSVCLGPGTCDVFLSLFLLASNRPRMATSDARVLDRRRRPCAYEAMVARPPIQARNPERTAVQRQWNSGVSEILW